MGDPAVHTPVVVHGTIRPRHTRHRAAGLHGGRPSRSSWEHRNQLSLWVLLGVPFLLVSLALVLNFGLGPYSLYFMRETAVATRIKTLLLGLPFTLAVGSLIAWLMADGAALGA